MKIIIKQLFIYSFILFAFSCKKDDDQIVEKHIDLPFFNNIEMAGTFDVYLVQDTVYKIKFVAPKKIIDDLDYSFNDTALIIANNFKRKWMNPEMNRPIVYIHCNNPETMNLLETCYVRTVNPITSPEFGLIVGGKLNMADLELNCHTFFYWNTAPAGGQITLRGNTTNLKIWNHAIMNVDARNVTTSYALVENKAKSDCHINVLNTFEYGIFGKGNIYLYSTPLQVIERGITDSGKLIKI